MKTTVILSAFVFNILVSCSPVYEVHSDYDKQADIANYTMYSWLSQQAIEGKAFNPLYYNELNDKRIKDAVDKQLQAKGFLLMQGNQPLQLHYHIIVEDKALVVNEPLGYGNNTYWASKSKTIYPYQQGTIIIDLMDTNNHTLVWRGWATGAIEPGVRKDPEEAVQKVVAKVFKRFPYRR